MIAKKTFKRFILLLACTMQNILFGQLQFTDNQRLSQELSQNLDQYVRAYTRPLVESYGASTAMMWDMGSKKHRVGRFRLGIQAAATLLPEEFKSFNFNELEFVNLELQNANDFMLPTITGAQTEQVLNYYPTDRNGNRVGVPLIGESVKAEIEAFAGINPPLHILPSAFLQASIDLPFHNYVAVRWLPIFGVENLSYQNLGLALQHQLSGWLPDVIPVDIRIGAFYTLLRTRYEIEFGDPGSDLDQHITLNSDVWGITFSASKNLKYIKPFIELNYTQVGNVFGIRGLYNFSHQQYSGISAALIEQVQFSIQDPVDYQSNNDFLGVAAGVVIPLNRFWIQMAVLQANYTHLALGMGVDLN